MNKDEALAKIKALRADLKAYQPNVRIKSFFEYQMKMNIRSVGAYSGARWNFDTEKKYKAFKTAAYGNKFGSSPFLTPKAMLTKELLQNFQVGNKRFFLTIVFPNAKNLFLTGGKNPFGEKYPARNPLRMKPHQKQQLDRLIQEDIINITKRHINI